MALEMREEIGGSEEVDCRLQDRADDRSCPSFLLSLSPYCISVINCSPLKRALFRDLSGRSSTETADPQGSPNEPGGVDPYKSAFALQ